MKIDIAIRNIRIIDRDILLLEKNDHRYLFFNRFMLKRLPLDSIPRSSYVLVIRRKDDGLTDIVSNEARRAEFDTISVRPSSFRRITYVKHCKLLTKQLS